MRQVSSLGLRQMGQRAIGRILGVSCAAAIASIVLHAHAQPRPATVPDPGWPAGANLGGAFAAAPAAPTGSVSIEQANRVIAAGTVLLGDGRVLSALRMDGPDKLANPEVTIRYEDGARVPGRVMHHDRLSGLALVVPLEGKRKEGEVASEVNPLAAPLRLGEGKRDKRVSLRAPNAGETISAGSEGWPSGLLVGDGSDNAIAGTALLDDRGHVAGVRTTRCALIANAKVPGGIDVRCTFPAVASVAAIRGFLMRTPANAVQPPAWLGIAGQANEGAVVRGVRVMAVAPRSSAATAALRSDATPALADVIVTIDGAPVTTPEQLAEVIAKYTPGDRIKLVVFTGVKSREVSLVLRAAP